MPPASTDLLVLAWVSEADDPPRLLRRLERSGATVRRAATEEALILACEAAPDAFVVVGAAGSIDAALEMCAVLRTLDHGERTTIAVANVPDSGGVHGRALAAGADVAWARDAPDSIVLSAIRRVGARARAIAGAPAQSPALAMIQCALDVVLVVSTEGAIQVANAPVQEMLGRTPSALEGSPLFDLVHPDDVHLARALLSEAVAAQDVAPPAVVRARRHDGSHVEVELSARNMLDDPTIRGVMIQARDVSERVSVGAALLESELRFRAIFENMLDGLVQIDGETRALAQANPAFCKFVGYSADELARMTLPDLAPPLHRERTIQLLEEHFRGERGVSEALCILHKDGTPRYVDIGTTRMELSGVHLLLAVVRDVTARRETERTRELFLAVVAHELRTPVAVLKNSVELLRSASSASDREILVRVLGEEVDRLARLVADAVDVGSIQAGNLALKPQRVSLGPIVESVVARVAPQFDGQASVAVEPASAYVDPLRFEQVLTNILDNAWRHGGGSVDVRLARHEGHARIDVTDSGPGFPPEMRQAVFERILVPNARPTSGIGIGLWLSKRLIVSMGGSIRASAGEDGRGARLTVSVPLLLD